MMKVENILIIKLSAIGDVIHALPVAHALKEQFPAARLTWIVEPPAYDLLTNNPCIDKVMVFEKKKFKSFGGFLRNLPSFSASLRETAYDLVLDLQGLGKSAAIAFLSKGAKKLGYCDMREFSGKISSPICGVHAHGHIVERYLDVARAVGCRVDKAVFPLHITEKEAYAAQLLMRRAGMRQGNPYVVLSPGANWPNKRWPTRHYAALAQALYDRRIVPVLIGGGETDLRLAAEVKSAMEIPPIDLVGQTTLKQSAEVILGAAALVAGDTGMMHLAAALARPAVALMGPTDGRRNGPYGQPENVLEIAAHCRHCWKRQCELQKDCLEELRVEAVMNKLEKYLPVCAE